MKHSDAMNVLIGHVGTTEIEFPVKKCLYKGVCDHQVEDIVT